MFSEFPLSSRQSGRFFSIDVARDRCSKDRGKSTLFPKDSHWLEDYRQCTALSSVLLSLFFHLRIMSAQNTKQIKLDGKVKDDVQ